MTHRLTSNFLKAVLLLAGTAFVVLALAANVQALPAAQTTPAVSTPAPPPPTATPVPTPQPTPTVAERNRETSSSGLPIVPLFLGAIFLGLVLAAVVPFVRARVRRR